MNLGGESELHTKAGERVGGNSYQEDVPFFEPPHSGIFQLSHVITNLIAILCNILLINFYLDNNNLPFYGKAWTYLPQK